MMALLFGGVQVGRIFYVYHTLQKAVRAAAEMQGSYRLSHLETHRRMRDLLTQEQVARYGELRGYDGRGASEHGPDSHKR